MTTYSTTTPRSGNKSGRRKPVKLTAAEKADKDARAMHWRNCQKIERVHEAAGRHGLSYVPAHVMRTLVDAGNVWYNDATDEYQVRTVDTTSRIKAHGDMDNDLPYVLQRIGA